MNGFESKSHLLLTKFQSDFDQSLRFFLVLSQISDIKGNTFLDIGCGQGFLGKIIERRGGKVVYLSPNYFDLKKIDSPTKILGDGIRLPFKNSAFDFVVSTDVFEHVAKQYRMQFLKEITRTTKKSSILTFSQLNTNNPKKSGINLFENNFKKFKIPFPEWYEEHNKTIMPELKDITMIFPQLELNRDILSYQGRLSILFLIFSIDIHYFLNFVTRKKMTKFAWIIEKLLHSAFYYILRIIDIPPFYSYLINLKK